MATQRQIAASQQNARRIVAHITMTERTQFSC
jgi:hypothetical protein